MPPATFAALLSFTSMITRPLMRTSPCVVCQSVCVVRQQLQREPMAPNAAAVAAAVACGAAGARLLMLREAGAATCTKAKPPALGVDVSAVAARKRLVLVRRVT